MIKYWFKYDKEKSDGDASISSLLTVSSSQVSVRKIQSSLYDVMRSLMINVCRIVESFPDTGSES